MESETTAKALKALADPTRLRIIEFLSQMCCGTAAVDEEGGVYEGPTAGEVCCYLTGAERINSTVSHHLHELEGAGLIRIERRGKRMVCALLPEALETLSDDLRRIAKGEGRSDHCS
jgi:ArsR family transcriptional regulator